MDLTQKIKKKQNYDGIIYTNLFGVIYDTPYNLLQKTQACQKQSQSRRFVRRDRTLHVVSVSQYNNDIINYNRSCCYETMEII